MKNLPILSIVLPAVFISIADAADVDVVFTRLMEETSSSWNVSQVAFNASATSNMAELASMNTHSSTVARAIWLESMLNFAVTTNDYRNYSLWMNEKVQWTSGCARRFIDVEFTNLWLRAADLLHDLKDGMRSNEDLLRAVADESRCNTTNAANMNAVVISNGMPSWYWREIDHMAARQQFAEIVRVVIVEQFGSRGMSRLPQNERWSFYSNFVERASLNENDRAEIRHAIEKTEEQENK